MHHHPNSGLCEAAAAAASNYALFKRSASTTSATDGRGLSAVGSGDVDTSCEYKRYHPFRGNGEFVRGGSVGNLLSDNGLRNIGGAHSIEHFLSGVANLHEPKCGENGKENLGSTWERVGSSNVALALWGSGARLVQAPDGDRNTFSSKGSSRDWGSNGSQLTTTTLSTPTRYSNRRITEREDSSQHKATGSEGISCNTIGKYNEKEDGTRVGFHLHPLLLQKEYTEEGSTHLRDARHSKTHRNAESQTRAHRNSTKFFSGVGELVGSIIGVRTISSRTDDNKKCIIRNVSTASGADVLPSNNNKRTVSFSNYNNKRKRRRNREPTLDSQDDGGFDETGRMRSLSLTKRSDKSKHKVSTDRGRISGILMDKTGVILERTTVVDKTDARSNVPNSLLVLDNNEYIQDTRQEPNRHTPSSERRANTSRGGSADRTSGEQHGSSADRGAGCSQYQVTEYSFDQPDSPFDEGKHSRTETRGLCRRRCKFNNLMTINIYIICISK